MDLETWSKTYIKDYVLRNLFHLSTPNECVKHVLSMYVVCQDCSYGLIISLLRRLAKGCNCQYSVIDAVDYWYNAVELFATIGPSLVNPVEKNHPETWC